MQQFFTPNIDLTTERYIFNEVESKHVAKVLRKNVGDILNLTNGKVQLIAAKLHLVSPKSCVVKLRNQNYSSAQNCHQHDCGSHQEHK